MGIFDFFKKKEDNLDADLVMPDFPTEPGLPPLENIGAEQQMFPQAPPPPSPTAPDLSFVRPPVPMAPPPSPIQQQSISGDKLEIISIKLDRIMTTLDMLSNRLSLLEQKGRY